MCTGEVDFKIKLYLQITFIFIKEITNTRIRGIQHTPIGRGRGEGVVGTKESSLENQEGLVKSILWLNYDH